MYLREEICLSPWGIRLKTLTRPLTLTLHTVRVWILWPNLKRLLSFNIREQLFAELVWASFASHFNTELVVERNVMFLKVLHFPILILLQY